MEKQVCSEMEIIPSTSYSYVKLLKINRELLVTHIRNTQCLVDNLLKNDYFSDEDAEIVGACPTQPDKVLAATGIGLGRVRGLVARRGFSWLT
ncbi:Nucleotide-binding oligomerization domain-containing protein 1 [Pteropus alecto]|uniref:Nucleotide-binding oligomerization domain-containing protein 1 n=1 Tax=Pteropus alecto TaxID=9402 RepID=L5KLU4_PTEAL|nr:Nucleotide-binding oligomerization domain-containing protein 1 [Pteropus alecto]